MMGIRLSMWPVFQKEMNAHTESVKKLVDGAGGGGFLSNKPTVRDTTVQSVCVSFPQGSSCSVLGQVANRYAVLFVSFVILTENEEETMIFSK
jgi:vacuolar protein sorting-associated protein 52